MNDISVVITSYNQKDLLREAVESVLAQTLQPLEIIVCDDASSDGSAELIAGYEKSSGGIVRGVARAGNVGIAANRSDGLERAEGRFLCWLDGDDHFLPAKLEKERALLDEDEECGWAYSQVHYIDGDGKVLGKRYDHPPRGFVFDEVVSLLGIAPRNPLVRRSLLGRTGLFRGDLELYEDFDLCLRLARFGKTAYCPEVLVEYRVHDRGLHCEELEKHQRALRRLQFGFARLIGDLPRKRRDHLEGKLEARVAVVLAQAALRQAGHP